MLAETETGIGSSIRRYNVPFDYVGARRLAAVRNYIHLGELPDPSERQCLFAHHIAGIVAHQWDRDHVIAQRT